MGYSKPGKKIFVQVVGRDDVFDFMPIISPRSKLIIKHSNFIGELTEVMVIDVSAQFQLKNVKQGIETFCTGS